MTTPDLPPRGAPLEPCCAPTPARARGRNRTPDIAGRGLHPNRRHAQLGRATRISLQVRRDELAHLVDQLDASIDGLAVDRLTALDELDELRERLWPIVPWQKGRRPPAMRRPPLPPIRVEARPVAGSALRSLCLQILERCGPLTLPDLHARLHHHGYVVDSATPVKSLADAMGYESDAGRAVRVVRGTYGLPGRPDGQGDRSGDPPADDAPPIPGPLDPWTHADPPSWLGHPGFDDSVEGSGSGGDDDRRPRDESVPPPLDRHDAPHGPAPRGRYPRRRSRPISSVSSTAGTGARVIGGRPAGRRPHRPPTAPMQTRPGWPSGCGPQFERVEARDSPSYLCASNQARPPGARPLAFGGSSIWLTSSDESCAMASFAAWYTRLRLCSLATYQRPGASENVSDHGPGPRSRSGLASEVQTRKITAERPDAGPSPYPRPEDPVAEACR